MFTAAEQEMDGPKAYLLSANNDPLGSIAAAAMAYKGEFVKSLAEITDETRKYYAEEVQKTALAMPLESVNFQFRITGVTRGFTHQMVRQRTAAYSQESTRFAVKETVPVGRPPSLEGTVDVDTWASTHGFALKPIRDISGQYNSEFIEALELYATPQQRWRIRWDDIRATIEKGYNEMVNSGMPAEDARGILPTNLLTQLNYHTSLRGLKDHAGYRLCTQAQFEWRAVWAEMIKAIREYGKSAHYNFTDEDGRQGMNSSGWQFDVLADLFRPICYKTGKCEFNADFDRKCSIRDRVEMNAENGIPSSEWESGTVDLGIPPISPKEWLTDPSAAR